MSVFISRLPGKALRTLVESRGLPINSTCVVKAETGTFVNSISKVSLYQFTHWFTLQTFVIGDVIQKVLRYHDLIKIHAVRWPTFIRSACNNAVNMRGN